MHKGTYDVYWPISKVVTTLIRPAEPFVTGIKMKSKDQDVKIYTNQAIKGYFKETIKLLIRVNFKQKHLYGFSSDQGPFLNANK